MVVGRDTKHAWSRVLMNNFSGRNYNVTFVAVVEMSSVKLVWALVRIRRFPSQHGDQKTHVSKPARNLRSTLSIILQRMNVFTPYYSRFRSK